MEAAKKPIIGILLKDIEEEGTREKLHVDQSYQFITSEQYTSYLQPYTQDICFIKPTCSRTDIASILSQINGVLLPGGLTDIYISKGDTVHQSSYAKAAKLIIDEAININSEGTIFPVFGICLGFEAIIAAMATAPIITKCVNCWNYNASVMLAHEVKSPLINMLGKEVCVLLQNQQLTYNTHNYMISTDNFYQNSGVSSFFNIIGTSLSEDKETKFISMVESIKYPIFGVQFHPELCMNTFYSEAVGLKPILNKESQLIGEAIIKVFIHYSTLNKNQPNKYKEMLLQPHKENLRQVPNYDVRCYVFK